MSFYRSALAALAAIALVTPVFADEDVSVAPQTVAENTAAPVQVAENDAAPVQLAENTAAPAQVAENTAVPAQVAENTAAPMQVADSSMSSDQPAAMEAKVNINKATVKEMMKMKGMSATKARAIMAYRKKHGDFKSLDDLKNVKGFSKMSEDKMKAMEDQMSVE